MAVPLVATNEAYFAKSSDYAAHDALICIAEGEVLITEDRRRLTPEHYFKSQSEMAALFADIPEAVENTIEIAMRCAYRVKSRAPILPRFADGDEAEELKRQAHEGLRNRLAQRGLVEGKTPEDYTKRLDFELDVITKMQFPGYFLIVADFIKYAKSRAFPWGRGAARARARWWPMCSPSPTSIPSASTCCSSAS
jgi:DNA polymerase III subunit alpha